MAAGKGIRFGSYKQLSLVGESTVLALACRLFSDRVDRIIVASPPDTQPAELRMRAGLDEAVEVVEGGSLREESVLNALRAASAEYVLIHDAARPACPWDLVDRVIKAMAETGCAVPALKPSSTLKYLEDDGSLKPLDRDRVYFIQTPQGYRRKQLLEAYETRSGSGYTDSSSIALEAGMKPAIVEGSPLNIKITVPEDLLRIREIIQEDE